MFLKRFKEFGTFLFVIYNNFMFIYYFECISYKQNSCFSQLYVKFAVENAISL